MGNSEVSQTSNGLTNTNKGALVSKTTNLSKFEDYKDYIESLLKAKAVPDYVKNPEIAFMMMEYGKARGFTPIDSLHFITPVNGVMTTNAKGIGWLLNDAKYVFRELDRASYIYFGDGKEVKSQRPLAPDEVAWKLQIDPKAWSEYSPNLEVKYS